MTRHDGAYKTRFPSRKRGCTCFSDCNIGKVKVFPAQTGMYLGVSVFGTVLFVEYPAYAGMHLVRHTVTSFFYLQGYNSMNTQDDQSLTTLLISHFANNEIEAAAALIEKTQLLDQVTGQQRNLALIVRKTFIEAVRQTNLDISGELLLPRNYNQLTTHLQYRQVGGLPVINMLREFVAHRDAALADWAQLQKEPCREITIVVPEFLQAKSTVWGVYLTHDYEKIELSCTSCQNERAVTLLTHPPRTVACPDCASIEKRIQREKVARWAVAPMHIDQVYVEMKENSAYACLAIDPYIDCDLDIEQRHYYTVPLSFKSDRVKGFRSSLMCRNQDCRNPPDALPVTYIFATKAEADQVREDQQKVSVK